MYDRNIFGYSSVVFDNLREMFANVRNMFASVRLAFGTILENLRIASKHVGAKPPPKCFISSWVFHIISHYLKSIDSFCTKLGR